MAQLAETSGVRKWQINKILSPIDKSVEAIAARKQTSRGIGVAPPLKEFKCYAAPPERRELDRYRGADVMRRPPS